MQPFGGNLVSHASTYIISLERRKRNSIEATLIKSPLRGYVWHPLSIAESGFYDINFVNTQDGPLFGTRVGIYPCSIPPDISYKQIVCAIQRISIQAVPLAQKSVSILCEYLPNVSVQKMSLYNTKRFNSIVVTTTSQSDVALYGAQFFMIDSSTTSFALSLWKVSFSEKIDSRLDLQRPDKERIFLAAISLYLESMLIWI